ncbi:MAG: helix-turn-helix transcriptional regulator [Lewinellaceae bacterium]|nr:helix-turn-helix transcriptional regulator [Saprospiraceae bacterium]MCB9341794.1 helix-turn-helix transcriptional regulator [Lewinellaceae bacterium]
MKTYQELLQTDTYWMTKIQNDLYNAVEDYLAENKMTRTQFADRLGVSKGYVTQLMSGEFNHRLSKLIELSLAIGKAPVLEFEDLQEVAVKESKGMVRRKSEYVRRAPFTIHVKHGAMINKQLSRTTKKQHLPNPTTSGDEGQWEMNRPVYYFNPPLRQLKTA